MINVVAAGVAAGHAWCPWLDKGSRCSVVGEYKYFIVGQVNSDRYSGELRQNNLEKKSMSDYRALRRPPIKLIF